MDFQKVELPQRLKLPRANFHFIVVGAGGTGGHLIPNLARLISVTKTANHSLTIVDGDEVENHNLLRQNFIEADVKRNKAEVMAERYGGAFGIEICYQDKYLKDFNSLYNVMDTVKKTPILIGCVDNNKTRQMFNEWFWETGYCAYIDAGNMEYYGQVVMGVRCMSDIQRRVTLPYMFSTPPVGHRYPDILSDDQTKFNDEMTCDERAVHFPQSIMANVMAATCIMNFVNHLILIEDGLEYTEVMFNANTGSMITIPNTMQKMYPQRFKALTDMEEAAKQAKPPAGRKTLAEIIGDITVLRAGEYVPLVGEIQDAMDGVMEDEIPLPDEILTEDPNADEYLDGVMEQEAV